MTSRDPEKSRSWLSKTAMEMAVHSPCVQSTSHSSSLSEILHQKVYVQPRRC